MTPSQCRAARGLLNWTQDDLAREAAVSVVTARNFENGRSAPLRATLKVMQGAFEAAGVDLMASDQGAGVSLRAKTNQSFSA